MNRSESKYFNTARFMDIALLSLLEKKEFEYITVKELCEKAGVNRSTFYLHYENMNDLLSESVDYLIREMENKFDSEFDKKQIEHCPLEELLLITPQYLIPYLEFVKENKRIFTAIAMQPAAFRTSITFHKMYDEIFDPILTRFNIPPEEKKYKITFYLNGMYAVIQEWIKGGCKESTNDIAELLKKCIILS